MKRNGFTLVELMIILAILAILAAIIIPAIDGNNAHGFEIGKHVLATDDNVAAFIAVLRHDLDQTVTVLTYAEAWTRETVDAKMDKMRAVQKKLYNGGVSIQRINIHFANKSGLQFEGATVPTADGVYISLD